MTRICAALSVSIICMAQTRDEALMHGVERMWREGNYGSVMKVAEERMKTNPDDLVGLILKLGFDMEYLNLDACQAPSTESSR